MKPSMNPEPDGSVARLPLGGGWPGRYFPVSTPCAMGDQTICPRPALSLAGITSVSMTRHSIEYCGWLLTNGILSSRASAAPRVISSAVHSETPT